MRHVRSNTDFLASIVSAALCVAFLTSAALFTAFPQIDLWASGVFFTVTDGFWIGGYGTAHALRDLLYACLVLVFLIALGGWVTSLCKIREWGVPCHVLGYVSALYFFGVIVLVNWGFKTLWGRARPMNVEDFGGSKLFTAPLDPATQCGINCSFVSGEAAGAAAMLISLILLFRYIPLGRFHKFALPIAIFIAAFTSIFRIMLGRHFLSDVVFSWLFIALIAWILHLIFLAFGNNVWSAETKSRENT